MASSTDLFLVNVTGRDRLGLLSSMTEVLSHYGVNVLDIGQAGIHDHISLGLLVEIPSARLVSDVMTDLLLEAYHLGGQVKFSPVGPDQYERWVGEQGKERRIITMMGRKLTAGQISAVASVCTQHNLNIDVITRLSGRVSLANPHLHPRACVQYSVIGNLYREHEMRSQLMAISQRMGVDISFHLDDIYRRNRRLVVFDMDSTWIRVEVSDELAKAAGTGEEVAAITAAAMRGVKAAYVTE